MNYFNKLKFNNHPAGAEYGKHALVFFDNGFGCSIVLGEIFYSNGIDTYEVAILRGNEDNYELCYSTDVTDDVIGYLTADEVDNIIKQTKEI